MPPATRKPSLALDIRFVHQPSGGAVYTRNLALAMIRCCPPCRYLVVHNPTSEPQRALIAELLAGAATRGRDVTIELFPVRTGCLTLAQHGEFLLRRLRSDAFFYPHFDAPPSPGVPLVLTIHDLYPLVLPDYCSPARRRFFAALTQRNCRRAARVIAVSQHTAADLARHLQIPSEKIAVIPHGCNRAFHPIEDQAELDAGRGMHDLPPEFILYTGNHKPHKNLQRLLHAFAALPAELAGRFPLLLTGRDRYTAALEDLAARLCPPGRVRFLGHVPNADLPALYNLASLYVLPSLYEGFGFGPLEALACGTPVAAARAAAIPEVVGAAATLFDPTDPADIAQAIETALTRDPTDRSARLAQAANFSWRKAALATWNACLNR